MAGEALVKVVGPFGSISSSGTDIKWDEKGHEKITRIFISYGDDYIRSLQFQYADQDGKLVLSPVYGEHNAPYFERLTFDVNEFITRLSGIYRQQHCIYRIVLLTIETNKKKHGPFLNIIESKGAFNKRFNFAFGPSNQFGGLHGIFRNKSNLFELVSIGVYVKP